MGAFGKFKFLKGHFGDCVVGKLFLITEITNVTGRSITIYAQPRPTSPVNPGANKHTKIDPGQTIIVESDRLQRNQILEIYQKKLIKKMERLALYHVTVV
jgi:hypothetical protein